MTQMFSEAGILAKLSIFVVLTPLIMGILYAIKPTEARLALMRPFSLAGIFAALTGFCTGIMNVLVGVSNAGGTIDRTMYAGLAESFVSCLLGFGCLTVAWLCVALGMRRQTP